MSSASSQKSSQQSLEDKRTESRKYILIKETIAKSKRGVNSTNKTRLPSKHDEQRVVRGSLWEESECCSPNSSPNSSGSSLKAIGGSSMSPPIVRLTLDSLELEDVVLQCQPNFVASILDEDSRLLLAIPTCEERYKVYLDKDRMQMAQYINVGSKVIVEKRHLPPCRGVVRWKGRIAGKQGVWFGVEIEDPSIASQVESDGTINDIRLFHCERNKAVFVNVSHINLIPPEKPVRKLKKHNPGPRGRSAERKVTNGLTSASDASTPSPCDLSPAASELRVDDRVVWPSEHGFERATVRWIGVLPTDHYAQQQEEEVLVGVEFDQPVGKGTGIYKNQRLFEAKKGHASLVPRDGLIPEREFNSWEATTLAPPVGFDDADITRSYDVCDDILRSVGLDYNQDIAQNGKPDMLKANKGVQSHKVSLSPLCNGGPKHNPSHQQQEQLQTDFLVHDTSESSISPQSLSDASSPQPIPYKSQPDPVYATIRRDPPPTRMNLTADTRDHPDCKYTCPNNSEQVISGAHMNGHLVGSPKKALPQFVQETPAKGEIVEGTEVYIAGADGPLQGIVRWIGRNLTSKYPERYIAAVQMEEESQSCTYGTFMNVEIVSSSTRNICFLYLDKCTSCRRSSSQEYRLESSSVLESDINLKSDNVVLQRNAPLCSDSELCTDTVLHRQVLPSTNLDTNLDTLLGKRKGIQGSTSSSCLDAILVSLFCFCTAFDSTLLRSRLLRGSENYGALQDVLLEEIVNPLRRHSLVPASSISKVMRLLEDSQSKNDPQISWSDPKRVANLLLQHALKQAPLVEFSNNQTCHILEVQRLKDERIPLPTAQQLLERFCVHENVRFSRVPTCLILYSPLASLVQEPCQMIFPSPHIDISLLVENAKRSCSACGERAVFECADCRAEGDSLHISAYCEQCSKKMHSNIARQSHLPVPLSTEPEACDDENDQTSLELLSVLSGDTSGYVSYCKVSPGSSKWVHFNSTASQQDGLFVSEVVEVPDLSFWLSPAGFVKINQAPASTPTLIQTLLSKTSIFIYHSSHQSTEL